jgi:phospholipase/carboxylesterase
LTLLHRRALPGLALLLLVSLTQCTRTPAPDAARYRRAAEHAAATARQFLESMEAAGERLAPDRLGGLAHDIEAAYAEPLRAARSALDNAPPPRELQGSAAKVRDAFGHVEQAFQHFTAGAGAPLGRGIAEVLSALHHVARAQEGFYAVRGDLPPFAGYWQMPNTTVRDLPAHAADTGAPATGVLHVAGSGHHGDFSLYIPETYSGDRSWPLIVALHGARGNGRDFLWTWVREAKSLGYLVVAPTSLGDTWAAEDDVGLLEVLSWVSAHYRLANHGVLLTGMSDGATYTLIHGLAHPGEYRALAPLCGVLHPANEALGNLRRARGMPIYLVHGAQDFLFPVPGARLARDTLTTAGALVEYRELPELSHTYPRSENVRILRWFEALPAPS